MKTALTVIGYAVLAMGLFWACQGAGNYPLARRELYDQPDAMDLLRARPRRRTFVIIFARR